MKAAIIERFGEIVVRDVPDPKPGPYEALCRLLYGATCTGTDTHIIYGKFPWIGKLPTILGHESVGEVVEIGDRVRNFHIGDRVTRVGAPPSADGRFSVTWGGFAEWGLARDHWAMALDGLPPSDWKGSRYHQLLPAEVDPRVAPMFTPWRETLSFLLRVGFRVGHSLLVAGSGGNGLSFARHAVLLGASTVGMIGAASREQDARQRLGVTVYLDYRRRNLTEEIRKAVPGGFDYIIDAIGRQGIAEQLLPALKPGGHYAVYGLDDLGKLTMDPSRARGPFTVHYLSDYDEAETHQQICEWVLQGRLDASAWYDVEHPFPLADISAAFEAVRIRRSPKALLKLTA